MTNSGRTQHVAVDEPIDQALECGVGDVRLHRVGEAAALLDRHRLEALELLGREAGAQLRDDVEIDEADRRRGDGEEEQDEPRADAIQGHGTGSPRLSR